MGGERIIRHHNRNNLPAIQNFLSGIVQTVIKNRHKLTFTQDCRSDITVTDI